MATSIATQNETPSPSASPVSGAVTARPGIFLFLLCFVLGIAVGSGLLFYLQRSGRLMGSLAVKEKAPVMIAAPPRAISLEPFLVNLADAGGKSYLRLSLILQVADTLATEKKTSGKENDKKSIPDSAMDEEKAVARDTILEELSTMQSDTLLANGGKEELKAHLKSALQKCKPAIDVREIYITDFLVQR